MAKNTVSTIISDIKILGDYNITDSSLDALLLKAVNYSVRRLRNLMVSYGIQEDLTYRHTFQTVAGQEYVDLTKAHIVGDVASFTGVAGDTVDVTIDGTAYADVAIAACTTIALVVAAINAAVGSTVASEDDNGYLMITSPTTGSSSSVTIADGTSTVATCIARLFSVEDERTQTAISDFEELMSLVDHHNESMVIPIGYKEYREYYSDPTSFSGSPVHVSEFQNYLYLGPTPDQASYYYLDYVKRLTALTSSSTLPFDEVYDELIVSMSLEWLTSFLDSKDRTSLLSHKERTQALKLELIVNSPKRKWADRQPDAWGLGGSFGPLKPTRMT